MGSLDVGEAQNPIEKAKRNAVKKFFDSLKVAKKSLREMHFHWLSTPIRSGVMADQMPAGHFCGRRGRYRDYVFCCSPSPARMTEKNQTCCPSKTRTETIESYIEIQLLLIT